MFLDLFPRWAIVSALFVSVIVGVFVWVLGATMLGTLGGVLVFASTVDISGSLVAVFVAIGNEWGYVSPASQRRKDERRRRREERRARWAAYRALKGAPPSDVDLREAARAEGWHRETLR